MRVFIIRHGQSTNNAGETLLDDPPLTPLGRKQMQRAAKWLAQEAGIVHWLFCSPLLRARQSAALLAKVLNMEPETWDDLQEYDEIMETEDEVWARAQRVADQLQRRFIVREHNCIVLVTHGMFASRFLATCLCAPRHIRFAHYNAAISLLHWTDEGLLRVRYTNFTGHLSGNMISS